MGWGGVVVCVVSSFNSSILQITDSVISIFNFQFIGYGGFNFHFFNFSISPLLRNTFNFQFSISIFNFEDSESTTVRRGGGSPPALWAPFSDLVFLLYFPYRLPMGPFVYFHNIFPSVSLLAYSPHRLPMAPYRLPIGSLLSF